MVEKNSIWIFGCGGHARVIRDSLAGRYHFAGFVGNEGEQVGHGICEEEFLAKLSAPTLAIIGIGDNFLRYQVFRRLSEQRFLHWESVVHPSAIISPDTRLGSGTFVSAGAIINTGAWIGNNVIINTGAIIEHDCVIEDSASIAPRVCLGGETRVGSRTAISIGASIRNGLSIGVDTVIGAGAVVLNDIPDCVVAYGVPATIKRERAIGERYL